MKTIVIWGIFVLCTVFCFAGMNQWTMCTTGINLSNFYSLAIGVAPSNQNIVYISGGLIATSGNRLYRSVNCGNSWSYVTTVNATIRSIVMDPNNSDILYLGTQGEGVLKSVDGGNTFQYATTGLVNPTSTYQLGIDPINSNIIYTGGVLSKSTDSGATWSPITTGIRGNGITTVFAIDPHDTGILYCVGYVNDLVFKSMNDGITWSISTNGLTNVDASAIMVDYQNSNDVYLCNDYGEGFCKSTNGGSSWMPMNNGLGRTDINGMCQDKLNPNIIYVVTGGGCYRTLDAGSTWNLFGTQALGYSIAMSVASTTTLFMAGDGNWSYTFSSTDIANNEWQKYDTGSPEGLSETKYPAQEGINRKSNLISK